MLILPKDYDKFIQLFTGIEFLPNAMFELFQRV